MTTPAEKVIPPVPFLAGLVDGHFHAVTRNAMVLACGPDGTLTPGLVHTACGALVEAVRPLQPFDRSYLRERKWANCICPECGWAVALAEGTADVELSVAIPTGRDFAVFERCLPDPLMVSNLCEAILRNTGKEYDADHPHLIELLGHVTRHAPVVLLPEECAEGSCDHRPDAVYGRHELGECPYPDATLGCPTCSVTAGSWAGEWEGQYSFECTVPAPCSVLTTMTRYYQSKG